MKHRLALIVPSYVLVYSLSYFVSYLLRFEFSIPEPYRAIFWRTLPFVLFVKVLACLARREWRRTYRYVTLRDVLSIGQGATLSAAMLYACNSMLFAGGAIPRSVIVIDWVLCILGEGLLRSGLRLADEVVRSAPLRRFDEEPTIIYRSDPASIGILRAIEGAGRKYRIVGFVDDDIRRAGTFLAGRPVLVRQKGWAQMAAKLNARHVLIPSTVPGHTVRTILKEASKAGIKTHVFPSVDQIVDGCYKVKIREVTISDLLRREPAKLDLESIRDYIAGRRVLVTGAAGSIGSELCRQVAALSPEELVAVDQSELGIFNLKQELEIRPPAATRFFYILADVTDRGSLSRAITAHRPQLIFHAAAYKHVPLMESNPHEAIRNNVIGTRNVVDLAVERGVERFVLISTDKAVEPSSVMGATKFLAEKYVEATAAVSQTKLITVRFGNVLNSAGSVVPTFRRQIEAGGPVTVTHPQMRRYFMTIPEAVQLVLQAGAIGASGDVLILEMGTPVRIVDLAKDLIALSGLKYPDDIDIIFTGVRPGEKLSEQLFYETERGYRKVHEKIYCSSHKPQVSLADVRWNISRLEQSASKDADNVVRLLRKIAAAYQAQGGVEVQSRKAA